MSTNTAEAAARPSSVIRIGGHRFTFVEPLIPDLDALGNIRELSPQGRYAKHKTVPLNRHGHGSFCRFRISAPRGLAGVYALVVDGSVRYIGECEDLRQRFNVGYGNISPRNCYEGGQSTNCKINRRVLDVSKERRRVDLYFHPTPRRHAIEKQLIASDSLCWND